jgi:hypothetical protein
MAAIYIWASYCHLVSISSTIYAQLFCTKLEFFVRMAKKPFHQTFLYKICMKFLLSAKNKLQRICALRYTLFAEVFVEIDNWWQKLAANLS